MRLIFAGTAEFAVPSLERLAGCHEIRCVLTQPDRPAGRGRRLKPTPVRARAEALGLRVATPGKLDSEVIAELKAMRADVLVVVAYGLLIPEALLRAFPHGGLNVHPSLLPRWRGAAPVERAMQAGDAETGVAIMRMDSGLDTGPVFRVERTAIEPSETAGELSARLARRGANLLLEVLDGLAGGAIRAQPQSGTPSYAARLERAEARLDFARDASGLAREVLALNPRPGAWAECEGERIRILRAVALPGSAGPPGRIIAATAEGIDVACGRGVLRILELQRPGKRPCGAADQVHGRAWVGACFG